MGARCTFLVLPVRKKTPSPLRLVRNSLRLTSTVATIPFGRGTRGEKSSASQRCTYNTHVNVCTTAYASSKSNFSLVDAAFLLSKVRRALEPVRLDDSDTKVNNLRRAAATDTIDTQNDTIHVTAKKGWLRETLQNRGYSQKCHMSDDKQRENGWGAIHPKVEIDNSNGRRYAAREKTTACPHVAVLGFRLRGVVVVRCAVGPLVVEQRPVRLAALTLDDVQVTPLGVVVPAKRVQTDRKKKGQVRHM